MRNTGGVVGKAESPPSEQEKAYNILSAVFKSWALMERVLFPWSNPTHCLFAGQILGGGSVVRTVPGHSRKGAGPGAPACGSIAQHPGRVVESSGENRMACEPFVCDT